MNGNKAVATGPKKKAECPPGKVMIEVCLTIMAGIGIALIIYGTLILFAPMPARLFLDKIQIWVDWISATITLIGVFLVALSGYFTTSSRGPDTHSLKYIAPTVMLFVVIAFITMYFMREPLNQAVVLGFAILALSGASFQSLPFSSLQPDTWHVPLFRPWPWWQIKSREDPDE